MENEITDVKLIFSGVFSASEDVDTRKQTLLSSMNIPSVFSNEYYIFFGILKEFPRIQLSKEFLQLYLQTNRAKIQHDSSVELAKYQLSDNDPYTEFIASCLALYDECTNTPVSSDAYYRNLEMYRMQYIVAESITILEESTIILAEGIARNKKQYSGYEDMRSYLKAKFQKLDNMLEKKERKGIITYGVNDEEESESGQINIITSYGVTTLDDKVGGIYEGDMVSLLAPSKGGKSRFTTYVLHNAVVNHGTPIVMWSIENGYKGWENLIRARHFNWFYNHTQTDVNQKVIINDDMIRKGKMSDAMKELELASWTDLKHNKSYGTISNIDEDFDADTFLSVIDEAVNSTGAKLICIDYLQLVSGSGNNTSQHEVIANVYKKLLQYIKAKKIGGIFPAQVKQSVIGDLARKEPSEMANIDLRDAAGGSYEVIKTPDVNLMLYGTVEDIRDGSVLLIPMPSRNSPPMDPIPLYCDMGSSSFADISKKRVS